MIKHAGLLSSSSRTLRGAAGIRILLFHCENTLSSGAFMIPANCGWWMFAISIQSKISNESHRLFYFCFFWGGFLLQERSSGVSFFLSVGEQEQITDLLFQIHCTSTWSRYVLPIEVRQTSSQRACSGILCGQSSSLFFSKNTQQMDHYMLWIINQAVQTYVYHLQIFIECYYVLASVLWHGTQMHTKILNNHHNHLLYIEGLLCAS